jgi:hypothetical protein
MKIPFLFNIIHRKFIRWSDTFKDSNPNYYKYFCHYYYDDKINFNELCGLFDFLKINKKFLWVLPKGVLSYKDFYELCLDCELVKKFKIFKEKAYNMYNNSQLLFAPKLFLDNLSSKDWLRLFNIRHEIPENIIRFEQFSNFFIKKNKFPFYDDRKEDIERIIIYNENNIIIVKIKTCEAFRAIGLKKWCIRDKDQWNEYVYKGDKQFITYDFNFLPDYPYFNFAFTINKNNRIKHCYNSWNNPGDRRNIGKYLKMAKIKTYKRPKTKVSKNNIIIYT